MIRGEKRFAGGTATVARHGRHVNVCRCPARVLASSHRLKMVGANTGRCVAEVVNLQPFGNRTDDQLVSNAMGRSRTLPPVTLLGIEAAPPVTFCPRPQPAAIAFGYLGPEALFKRGSGQEGGAAVVEPAHVVLLAPRATGRGIGAVINRTFHGVTIAQVAACGNPS